MYRQTDIQDRQYNEDDTRYMDVLIKPVHIHQLPLSQSSLNNIGTDK